jgi:Dolichyl-phosphate-mannose-protein mannosyltransferase
MTESHASVGTAGTFVSDHPDDGVVATAPSNPTGLREWMVVVLIALVSIGVFIIFRAQPGTWDEARYLEAASAPLSAEPNHWSTRLGLTLPTWAAMQLFGYSEAAYYLLPIVLSTILIVATYLLGRVTFGRLVGLAASGIILTLPWVLPAATKLLPDVGLAALLTGAVTAVIAAANRSALRGWDRSAHLLLVAAGAMLGWAYLVREMALVFMPIALFVAFLYKVRPRSLIHLAWPVALTGVAESLYGWVVWGSPLAHLNVVVARSSDPATEIVVERSAAALARQTSAATFTIFPEMLLSHVVGVIVLFLAVGLVLAVVLTRQRQFLALGVWALTIWVGLTAVGVIPRVIRLEVDRYWIAILPPIIVGGLGAMSLLGERWASRRLALTSVAVVGAVALALGLSSTMQNRGLVMRGADDFQELRAWLAEQEGDQTLWADSRTAPILALYTRRPFGTVLWPGEVRPLNDGEEYLPPEGVEGTVVLRRQTLDQLFNHNEIPLADYVVAPPLSWEPAAITENGEIVAHLAPENGDMSSWDESAVPWSVGRGGVAGYEPIAVGPDERLTVRLTPEDGLEEPLVAGSVLEVRVMFGATGEGRVRFPCVFTDGGGESVNVPGSAAFAADGRVRPVAVYCRVPTGIAAPIGAAMLIDLVGPIEARIGGAAARVVSPSLLTGTDQVTAP